MVAGMETDAEQVAQAVAVEENPTHFFHGKARNWGSLHQLRELPAPIRELLAGGLAGATAKSCVAPLERCKILFQTGKLHQARVGITLADIYRSEGWRGLFRGNGASVLRIVPYASVHFSAYEYYRRLLVDAGVAGASHASVPPVVDLLAGSSAGATAVLVTYPLDLVRTRLAFHTEGGGGIAAARGLGASSSSSAASSTAAAHAARAASGLGASSSGATSATAAAAASRVLHALPQHAASQALTIRGVLLGTWQREGVRGIYHGVGASFYGILPYAGLKFYVYQHLKKWYLRSGRPSHGATAAAARSGSLGAASSSPSAEAGAAAAVGSGGGSSAKQRLPVPVMLTCGAVAGLVAQSATYPFDVVRRRMQVEGLSHHMPTSTSSRAAASRFSLQSTPQAMLLLARREGWRTLWSGLSINYMKVVPSTAIGFTIYDWLKGRLGLPQNL